MRNAFISSLFLLTAASAVGCGHDDVWDTFIPSPIRAYGMTSSVALLDAPADRMLVTAVDGDLAINPVSITIGHGFAAAQTTPSRDRVLVLMSGDVPRRTIADQPPSLAVIGGGTSPSLLTRYQLSDPLSGLAIDPAGELAVMFAGDSDTSFVQNPNELVLVDLARGPAADNPSPLTLRSFGGRPEAFTFTPVLSVPGGPRRLLVVQTDRDVALVDLSDRTVPEITVRLTGGPDALVPGGVAVTDGALDRDDDARIAIRVVSDPNVVIVDLLPVPAAEVETTPQSFRATPNIVYAGGTPTDIAFVQTDGGLRLAALVPSQELLTLIDPATGIASQIALGAPFERISLVTDIVGATATGSDVALLWSGSSPNVAFVALGSTVGKPYKAIERLELSQPVAQVIDIPSPNQHLKLLASADGRSFVVLDLIARTASPLAASAPGTRAFPAPNGSRAWIFADNTSSIASLDLATLHPQNIPMSYPVINAFEIDRSDGGRALVAVHQSGAGALTVLDADKPDLATARETMGLLLGDLR